ncbi:hypothetical protein HOLleu_33095 [Holothuria leucospilota]|uniref:Uncharacterized protein n=1 Tax=Holothuria leucospilota TaxID=206669 RepID=A0A9Q0YTC2_HOLLE|nr:hypothetical protein HOLleu_33095 [Holothuria leucospilota]
MSHQYSSIASCPILWGSVYTEGQGCVIHLLESTIERQQNASPPTTYCCTMSTASATFFTKQHGLTATCFKTGNMHHPRVRDDLNIWMKVIASVHSLMTADITLGLDDLPDSTSES